MGLSPSPPRRRRHLCIRRSQATGQPDPSHVIFLHKPQFPQQLRHPHQLPPTHLTWHPTRATRTALPPNVPKPSISESYHHPRATQNQSKIAAGTGQAVPVPRAATPPPKRQKGAASQPHQSNLISPSNQNNATPTTLPKPPAAPPCPLPAAQTSPPTQSPASPSPG
jgi:hypothetical protein